MCQKDKELYQASEKIKEHLSVIQQLQSSLQQQQISSLSMQQELQQLQTKECNTKQLQ